MSFDAGDDLQSDNRAFATLAPSPKRQVLVLGSNPFLERALALDGSATITRGSAKDFQSAPRTRFDVVVCDGVSPPPVCAPRTC
jgi:hypothetical protein